MALVGDGQRISATPVRRDCRISAALIGDGHRISAAPVRDGRRISASLVREGYRNFCGATEQEMAVEFPRHQSEMVAEFL